MSNSTHFHDLTGEGFQELQSYLSLSFLEIAHDGTLVALSPAAEFTLGLEQTAVGQPFVDLPNKGKLELRSLQRIYRQLANRADQGATTKPVVSADGAGHSWNFRPVRHGGWLLVGSLAENSEYLLQQMEQSVKLIQDQKYALDSAAIVAITDQWGIITHVNDTFCRISGYSRAELIGKTHRVINSKVHSKEFFKELWETIARGEVWKGEICNRAKDGSLYWVDTTIVPFVDDQTKKPYQYVAIRSDITKEKQAMESLNQERARSWHAEKMVSLGEMAAGIAHELGNPIASIQAWLDVMESQMLRGVQDMDKFLKTLPKVREDTGRIRDIIRGMLTYARDGSRDPCHSENVGQMVKLVRDYCSYKLRKLGVDWQVDNSNPYTEIECRLSEMTQVFVNFVLNACDAIREQDDKWIKVSVDDQGERVVMRFMDSGAGIEPEVLERIWNPFFTTKPVGSGTGLGLSISRSIIENHHGEIWVDQAAANTCFVLELPKKQPPATAATPE